MRVNVVEKRRGWETESKLWANNLPRSVQNNIWNMHCGCSTKFFSCKSLFHPCSLLPSFSRLTLPPSCPSFLYRTTLAAMVKLARGSWHQTAPSPSSPLQPPQPHESPSSRVSRFCFLTRENVGFPRESETESKRLDWSLSEKEGAWTETSARREPTRVGR